MRPTVRDFLERADVSRASSGLANHELTGRLVPGAVVIVKDEHKAAALLPDLRPAHRTFHRDTGRRAIVLQSDELNRDDALTSILIVPCSSTHKGVVGPWDLLIPEGESAFTKGQVVAYTSLVQPMLKAEILEMVGTLSPATLGQVTGRVARCLKLGPRELGLTRG